MCCQHCTLKIIKTSLFRLRINKQVFSGASKRRLVLHGYRRSSGSVHYHVTRVAERSALNIFWAGLFFTSTGAAAADTCYLEKCSSDASKNLFHRPSEVLQSLVQIPFEIKQAESLKLWTNIQQRIKRWTTSEITSFWNLRQCSKDKDFLKCRHENKGDDFDLCWWCSQKRTDPYWHKCAWFTEADMFHGSTFHSLWDMSPGLRAHFGESYNDTARKMEAVWLCTGNLARYRSCEFLSSPCRVTWNLQTRKRTGQKAGSRVAQNITIVVTPASTTLRGDRVRRKEAQR